MIYYICALKCEAAPIIRRLGLKKNPSYTRMDVFENESSVVMVAGSGMVNAAMSVTELLCRMGAGDRDFIVNVGICGYMGNKDMPLGTALMCSRIKSGFNGREYYPDMIYRSPFKECAAVTFENAVNDYSGKGEYVADMEAAGIYESAIRFVRTSQIAFIKIVSDYCDGIYPTKEQAESYIEENADTITEWAESIHDLINSKRAEGLTADEESLMNDVADSLNYSVTRRHQFRKQLIYDKITGKDVVKIMKGMQKGEAGK